MNDAERVARKLLGEPEFQIGDRVSLLQRDERVIGTIAHIFFTAGWYSVFVPPDKHIAAHTSQLTLC